MHGAMASEAASLPPGSDWEGSKAGMDLFPRVFTNGCR